jgi:two-component system OmpR family response regulator
VKPRHVRVGDDDPQIRMILIDIIALEGDDAVGAADGIEALAAIDHELPDLILLDMWMPHLDGWGVARELRKRDLRIPDVMVSASTDCAAWAGEIHADAYLGKPFDLTELLHIVTGRCPLPEA